MGVRTLQRTDGAVFFCTFTCWKWLALIERTKAYDRMYNWMHIATGKGFSILGYVIMPNHVHLLIHAPEGASTLPALACSECLMVYPPLAVTGNFAG